MKATLEFDLNDIDDRLAHLQAVKAPNIISFLWEFDQYLRGEAKYKDNEQAEEIRERFTEMRHVANISFDELYH